MENPFKRKKTAPNTVHEGVTNKVEKSQAELRDALKERFFSMKNIIEQEVLEYKASLKDEKFEDTEGEEEGSGEKRKELMQAKINTLFDRAEQMKAKLNGNEDLPQYESEIRVTYKNESIALDLEVKIQEFKDLYDLTNINPPVDFENTIKEIWGNNIDAIQKAIEENGFDEVLLIPGNVPLPLLNSKMTDVYEDTYESSNFKTGGSFAGAQSQNADKTRIVLVHKDKAQNLGDRPELQQTLNIKGQDVKLDQTLTLEDYLVFQRKYFEETNQHLDSDGWTWLATKSGTRLVDAYWYPGGEQVDVGAYGLDFQDDDLGARPSRSFY